MVLNELGKESRVAITPSNSVNSVILYFEKYYHMTAIDLSIQQALDLDPKAIQQTNFTRDLENNFSIFFIIEEAKESILDFSQGTLKVL